jgi:acetylglutamate kinase
VIAPITHDGAGQLLNTNADIMASHIAAALGGQVSLTYVFDHAGVLRDVADATSVIPELRRADVAELVGRGIVTAGMRPKLDMAFAAIEAGVSNVRITSAYTMGAGTVCW